MDNSHRGVWKIQKSTALTRKKKKKEEIIYAFIFINTKLESDFFKTMFLRDLNGFLISRKEKF